MQRSRRMLQRPREERREAIRLYAGDHWSEETSKQSQPINLISQYIQIMLRNLVAKNPRALLSTFQGSAKATVSSAQTWINKEIVRMNLAESLRRWVMDAMFSVGIMKVALATPSDSATMAWSLQAGKPFAKSISLDDFVVDPNARDPEEVQFIGHRYRVPLDTVKDSKLYSKARKHLNPTPSAVYNDGGDERAQMLGRGYNASGEDEIQDMVDLWEVYLPRYRSIITLPDDAVTGATTYEFNEPLREQAWLGPDWGPYLWMRLGVIPDNIMPKAPIHDLIEMHNAANHILRKLLRQARRQKSVLPVPGASAEDVERLNGTDDGFSFRCDNPQGLKEVVFGGPNQQNFVLFMAIKDLFSFMGGNLDLLGGRGAQSPTATQDKMLNENASMGVSDMQETVVNGVAKVIESLTWYWWHDPFKVMRTTYQIPGMPELSIPLTVSPQERMSGSWEDIDIHIDPYSMQHSTPQSKLGQLNMLVQKIIAPMMPLLQQQGVVFDVHAYLEKIARYMDLPDLQEIITLREPPMQDVQSGAADLAPPGATERTYNRVSTSEQTDKGFERNMMGSLMGVDQGGSSDNGAM